MLCLKHVGIWSWKSPWKKKKSVLVNYVHRGLQEFLAPCSLTTWPTRVRQLYISLQCANEMDVNVNVHVWSPPMSSGNNFCVGFGAPQHIPAAHLANNSITVWHCNGQSYDQCYKSLFNLFQNAFYVMYSAAYNWIWKDDYVQSTQNRNESALLHSSWVYLWTPCM